MDKKIGAKSRSSSLPSVFIAVFLLLVWIAIGLAQEGEVDVRALVQETQKWSGKQGEVTLIWWVPEEYWRVSIAQGGNVTVAQVEEVIKVLRPYIVIVVVDGKVGSFGGITYTPEPTIRATLQIRDSEGVRYHPLDEDTISPDSKNFLLMIKPLFANLVGQLGQNMQIFLFPAENKKGQKIAEAKKEGTFSVELDEREFKWRLPLGSLLIPKICPVCGEKLSGAYKFCPWDGTKLSETKK